MLLEEPPVKYMKKRNLVTISKYLDESLIVFLDVASRDEALQALVEKLDSSGKLLDKETFYQAILEREKIVSTGIGHGVAIPHAKLKGYPDFFIAIGVQNHRGIAWNALDGSSVTLILMIGGPEDRQTEYLQILSRLTLAVKEEERRELLRKATKPKQIVQLLKGC